ncbi:hypothetical protein KKJ04_03390 [Xenorhabdus bovienii]|nr:hypothetical protein [Xenorhabdus bovienii]
MFIYYVISTHPSPLYLSLTDSNSETIAIRRIQVTRNLTEISNTYIISIGYILSYLVSYCYIAVSAVSAVKRRPIITSLSVIISILFLLLSSEKAPIVFYLLGLLISYNTAKGKITKINTKIIIFILSFIIVLYLLFVSNNVTEIISKLTDRLFIAQSISVYLSLKYYSLSGDLSFNTLSNIFTKILDIKTIEPASVELMKTYYSEMIAVGGWNVNGLFIHEAWANFGALGIIIAPIIVTIENAIVFSIVILLKRNVFQVSIYSYMTINCVYFLTSFNAYFYHSNLLIFSIILTFYYLTNKIISLLKTPRCQ